MLYLKMFPLLHLLILWEGDSINALQTLRLGFTLPVGGGILDTISYIK